MSEGIDLAALKERAEARRGKVTVEVVKLGEPKAPPYADASPEERLEAAVRLMNYHVALRGGVEVVRPRSEWPGETFKCGPRDG